MRGSQFSNILKVFFRMKLTKCSGDIGISKCMAVVFDNFDRIEIAMYVQF